jgi:hypothetical protein
MKHPTVYKFFQLSGGLLICSLLVFCHAAPALARYTPSRTAPRVPTGSTGRRGGCTTENRAKLTVLAPKSHVGQTISSHPRLAWFVPDAVPLSMEFYLYELDATGNRSLIQQANLQSNPGIMSLPLSPNQPGLEVGKRYYWQIVLLCDANHPSSGVVVGAEIERVEPSPALTNALATASSLADQSMLYAEAGLWYDAMNTAFEANSEATIISLLENLMQVEVQAEVTQVEQSDEEKHSDKLNQVIMFEVQR